MRPFVALCIAALSSTLGAAPASAADLSATEMRWLRGMWPVVQHARQSGLALDIVVQPQPAAGAAPLALGFVGGRCKLVLSMRDNPEAAATLERIAPERLDATLELMAAHELGHCRRYTDGAWHGVPAGFVAAVPRALDPELREAWADMQAARREEAYGDLVGLAWTRQQHPQQYAALQAWLITERARDLSPGSPHDTLAWVRLADDGASLQAASIFVAATVLWTRGLATQP